MIFFPGRTQWDRRSGLLSPFSLRFCGCSFAVGVCRGACRGHFFPAFPASEVDRFCRMLLRDRNRRKEPIFSDLSDLLPGRSFCSRRGENRSIALPLSIGGQKGNGNRRHSHFLWKSRVAADESRSILPHPSFSARRGDSASRYHPRRSACRLSLQAEIPHVRFFRSPVHFRRSRTKSAPFSPRFSGEFRPLHGKK